MIAYKLVKKRKDGSLGPLFINARQRLSIGQWMNAEAYKKKGFAFRPGWHCTGSPKAPHLSKKGRVWVKVVIDNITEFIRPENQGGLWYLAQRMKIIEELS